MKTLTFWKKFSLILTGLLLSFTSWSQCTYTLEMLDSYGDGWNGNTIDVIVNSTVVLDDVTLSSGSSGTMTFTVNTGDNITTLWNGGGSWGSETSYNILNITGTVVGSGAQTSITTPITANCPSCPAPSGLAATSITNTSASLSWTSPAINSNLEWGMAGFTPGTGTMVINASNPYNLSSLSSGTSYDFYVQDSCSTTDVSSWTGPYTFNTALGALPYAESFENNDFGLWTQVTYDDEDWSVNSYGTTSSNTGPSGASDGTYYAYCETSSPVTNSDVFVLESPEFDFTNEPGPALLFDYHMLFNAYTGGTLNVDVTTDNGTTWTTVWTKTGDQGTAWNSALVNLSSYASQSSVILRFHFTVGASGTAYYYDAAIDNILVTNITCYPSTNLTASNITNTSATLNWTTGGASSWLLEYGPEGFTQGSGTTVNVSALPYTLNNLSLGTSYDFYVRDICSASDSSQWAGPANFVTNAPPLSGTYTIGDTTGGANYDFPSFQAAADYLAIGGVNGVVTFNVASGTYTEQVVIDSIPGVSTTNTVTFTSNTGDSNDVVLQASMNSTSEAVLLFNNTEYVTFSHMTIRAESGSSYGRVVQFENESHNIKLLNNVIETEVSSSSYYVPIYSTGSVDNDITIKNNHLKNGYYSLYWRGSNSSNPKLNTVIENNYFDNYYYYGAYFYYMDGMQFNNNKLRNSSSSGSVYGMRAYYADNTTITNNDIAIAGTGTHYGMYFRGDGTSTNPNLIANNVINLTGTGSSTWYGMYIYYNDYSNIYHNTVNLTAGSSTARALYTSSGSDVNIENNIFTNAGGGYAAYISTTSAINTMDYNVYNTTGSNIAYWSGAKATLADLQSANSMDANSIEADPVFTNVSSNDLTPISSAVDNIGTSISSITTDIFGSPRDPATPDAGAIEFTGISADLALTDGELVNGQCLSVNDSVYLTIENPLLTTADFAANNLVANWSVTGPQNSSGSIVINSGTLMPNSTLIIGGDGVDLSASGDYVLSAWIDPNSDNGFTGNDSLLNYTTHTVNSLLSVSPQYDTIYSPTDTIDLSAQSPFFPGGTVFLTEICHWAGTSTGEPTGGQPIYLGDDYVEITGVPNSDLSGYTFEKWSTSGSSPDVTHTFPAGTSFSPSGTYLLSTYQGSTSLADYHQVADVTDSYSSSTNSINIIKDPTGTIVDVVLYETSSTIPAAAGVSASDWSGPGIDGSSSWGIRLTGPDTDDNTNWVKATQDPNVLNAGVTAPAPASITGFAWSYQGNIINNNVIDIVVGPFTSNGTYEYVASYNTPCGMVYDTARITVMAPAVTTTMGTLVSCNPGDSVDMVLDFTGTPPWDVQITDGSDTLWIPNITTTPFTISDTPLVTTNYEALMVNDANGWNYSAASITAEVYDSPVISASISPDPVNYGTPAMLDVTVSGSSSYSYAWSPADSLANPMNYNIKSPMTKNLSTPMTFSVVVTDNVTGCSSTADVNVSIVGGPLNAYLSSNRDTVCQGDTTQLFSSTTGGSGNYTYNWSSIPSGFNSSNPNPVVTVNSETTYILTINDGFSNKTESITISNWNVPSFTLSSNNGPSYVECATFDTLSASPSGGMFYGTAVSGNTFYPSAAGTGMYTIYYDYVDPNGCHYLENMALTVTPDITSPTVNTKNITVPLDANGQASVSAGDINDASMDNCGIAGYSIDQQYFTCADLGANLVTLTAYDNRGNSASNTAQVTIVDNTAPTISTVNVPVFLDGSGQATILPADVDNGTFDACGLDSIMISQNTFDCQDIGPNLIIFSAMDVNGNSSSTPVVITVYDNISPVVNTQSTTAYLNAYGLTTISPSDVDNGSTDNCAIKSMSLNNHMFTCSDLGLNSVNLTVTDVNMNSASSTAQVNVLDTIAPNVVTKDITVYLDNNGNAGISASDINNGSSDNCGIATMTLSKSSYNCSDLGVNTVTLTASDQSGNTNSSIANVTVIDTISPVITHMSDTIVCPGLFNYTTPTATDNCGATVTQTAGPDGGDALSGGIYTFSYTATDQSGNTAHTSFTVTVSEPDISLGQDISVCHDDTVTLTATAGYTSYLWSTGEVSNTISLDSLSLGMGTHAIWVTVTDSLGCTASDSINVTFQNCVGIHEFVSEGDITIYPNPTKGLFTMDIKGLKDKNIQICIYNFSGQKVVCEEIESNFQNGYHKTFDLSHQPAGIYLIKLTGANINRVERIIIQ